MYTVGPQTSLREAMSKMIAHQVSHLPVMVGEHAIKGMLRWKDIGKYLLLADGNLEDPVSKAMVVAKDVQMTALFLAVIPEIIQHGCVLVRDGKSRVSGIVTKKDLGRALQSHAAPFVTLGEIERCLRALIERGEFTAEELRQQALDPANPREVNQVADLTLGEYQRLMSKDDAWSRIGLKVTKKTFTEQLEKVRLVRNDVMHFGPDSPTDEDRQVLENFLELVYDLRRFS